MTLFTVTIQVQWQDRPKWGHSGRRKDWRVSYPFLHDNMTTLLEAWSAALYFLPESVGRESGHGSAGSAIQLQTGCRPGLGTRLRLERGRAHSQAHILFAASEPLQAAGRRPCFLAGWLLESSLRSLPRVSLLRTTHDEAACCSKANGEAGLSSMTILTFSVTFSRKWNPVSFAVFSWSEAGLRPHCRSWGMSA